MSHTPITIDQNSHKQDAESALNRARNLSLLGILLQCLHVLFGVTGLIGVLITQHNIGDTSGTPYHSQLRWQFVTFWLALVGYSVGFYFWIMHANYWVLATVLVLLTYRMGVSIWHWIRRSPINRVI